MTHLTLFLPSFDAICPKNLVTLMGGPIPGNPGLFHRSRLVNSDLDLDLLPLCVLS